jgi:ferredoxin-NADP reductase
MQSSPGERNITITFSVVGKYTRRMAAELTVGRNVWLKLPYGELFSRPHSKENCVFVAGGTGVTPYLSLFCDSSFVEYVDPKLYLGLKSAGHNIYHESLNRAVKINERLNINHVHEDSDGLLNIEKIYSENGAGSTYFVSGPPTMIRTFRDFLGRQCVTEGNIITDDWE